MPCVYNSRGRSLLFLNITLHLHFMAKLVSSQVWHGNTISQGFNLTATDFLTSQSGEFKLQFLSLPDSSQNYYLGITWKGECIWLANRNNPLHLFTEPRFLIDEYGDMKILYSEDAVTISIYSSEAPKQQHRINASATLTDGGSLELSEKDEAGNKKRSLWSSFDYPNNILLPGMKLGFDKVKGNRCNLTSWVASQNPDLGSFTFGIDMDSNNTIQLGIWWRGNLYWSGGALLQWPDDDPSYMILYYFENLESALFSNSSDGNEVALELYGYLQDAIGLNPQGELTMGASVSCNRKSPAFVKGCEPPKPPNCRHPDAYVSMLNNQYGSMSKEGYKVEGTDDAPLYDCGVRCLMNCSCAAYSFTNNDGTGCQIWDNTTNFKESLDGQQIYFIRDDKRDNPQDIGVGKTKTNQKLLIVGVVGGALLTLMSATAYICHLLRRKGRIEAEKRLNQKKLLNEIGDIAVPFAENGKGKEFSKTEKTGHEIHIFSFESMAKATNNFSSTNKLGEGGFGPVYKVNLNI
ncbi:G-type lectin S-receptor-like serine/threonine-protein kinase CES101 isoform X2 [Senna tora]|uniref:G-type lectin S-receptor-like serine/threonine-protein kinase CES101 isoform X2 n=1 Tax=Senna tora TaxID=362788 RepID=A0A834T0J7_9FABA|nr:G-type lectin S-receptor-like serine/threonine-protein kinase CES101 isoform X2 [Senna tora]